MLPWCCRDDSVNVWPVWNHMQRSQAHSRTEGEFGCGSTRDPWRPDAASPRHQRASLHGDCDGDSPPLTSAPRTALAHTKARTRQDKQITPGWLSWSGTPHSLHTVDSVLLSVYTTIYLSICLSFYLSINFHFITLLLVAFIFIHWSVSTDYFHFIPLKFYHFSWIFIFSNLINKPYLSFIRIPYKKYLASFFFAFCSQYQYTHHYFLSNTNWFIFICKDDGNFKIKQIY